MIRTAKKGKTCTIALTSFALAHSLLAGQKIKISMTNRKSCSFKKAPLQALIYSLLKYCKMHGVNKVRNIALCSRVERMERKHRSRLNVG